MYSPTSILWWLLGCNVQLFRLILIPCRRWYLTHCKCLYVPPDICCAGAADHLCFHSPSPAEVHLARPSILNNFMLQNDAGVLLLGVAMVIIAVLKWQRQQRHVQQQQQQRQQRSGSSTTSSRCMAGPGSTSIRHGRLTASSSKYCHHKTDLDASTRYAQGDE